MGSQPGYSWCCCCCWSNVTSHWRPVCVGVWGVGCVCGVHVCVCGQSVIDGATVQIYTCSITWHDGTRYVQVTCNVHVVFHWTLSHITIMNGCIVNQLVLKSSTCVGLGPQCKGTRDVHISHKCANKFSPRKWEHNNTTINYPIKHTWHC